MWDHGRSRDVDFEKNLDKGKGFREDLGITRDSNTVLIAQGWPSTIFLEPLP